jgi:succinoglycan biosynthesis protein ExoO
MVEFREGAGASLFAEGSEWRSERPIDLISYIAAHHLYGDAVSLGYLKPLLHMGFLRSRGLEYDARLRIGEDYDLVVRAIGAGARFLYLPRPSYFYRRHEASTSHRLARKDLVGLIESADAGGGAGGNEAVRQALAERRASLIDALAHHDAIEALKAKRPLAMLGHLARHPGAVRLMIRSVREAVGKRIARAQKGRAAGEDRLEVALLLGVPAEGSAIAELDKRLVRAGLPVVRKPLPTSFEEAGLASASTRVKLILLGEPAAADAAPFALSPEAPWVADAGVEHPAVALHVALGAAGDALDLTTLDEDRLLATLRTLHAKQPAA